MFLFPRWDMLVPWRLVESDVFLVLHGSLQYHFLGKLSTRPLQKTNWEIIFKSAFWWDMLVHCLVIPKHHWSPVTVGQAFKFHPRRDNVQKKTGGLRYFLESRWPQKNSSPNLRPSRSTWHLHITHLERKMIFRTSMIMFYINLQWCNYNRNLKHSKRIWIFNSITISKLLWRTYEYSCFLESKCVWVSSCRYYQHAFGGVSKSSWWSNQPL